MKNRTSRFACLLSAWLKARKFVLAIKKSGGRKVRVAGGMEQVRLDFKWEQVGGLKRDSLVVARVPRGQ